MRVYPGYPLGQVVWCMLLLAGSEVRQAGRRAGTAAAWLPPDRGNTAATEDLDALKTARQTLVA